MSVSTRQALEASDDLLAEIGNWLAGTPANATYVRRIDERIGLNRAALAAAPAPTNTSDPEDGVLDRAIKTVRIQTAALETVRREVALPDHVAEIVGDALAKNAHRAPARDEVTPSSASGDSKSNLHSPTDTRPDICDECGSGLLYEAVHIAAYPCSHRAPARDEVSSSAVESSSRNVNSPTDTGERERLWELVGVAEAYFAADTDEEAGAAESAFHSMRARLAAVTRIEDSSSNDSTELSSALSDTPEERECGCAYEVLPGGVYPERRYFHEPDCRGAGSLVGLCLTDVEPIDEDVISSLRETLRGIGADINEFGARDPVLAVAKISHRLGLLASASTGENA